MNTKQEDKATEEVNALETTKEESSSEEENLEDSKEKVEEPKTEEISSDYLGEKEEVDYKKRYGDSTREYQTLQEETKKKNAALENLEKLAKLNPRILTEIETAQKQGGDSTLIQQQVEKALEPVRKIAQDFENKDRQGKVKVLAAFEKGNPDLFPPKSTREQKAKIRQRIGKVANALVETGMEYKDAVKRAYFTVNPKAAIQKGKDEAYLEGLGEKQAGFSGQTSSEGKKPGKSKYTQAEMEKAKKFGPKVYKSMLKEK